MRAVIQKVKKADLYIDGKIYSRVNRGLVVLLGVEDNDEESDLAYILKKIVGLRIFEDKDGKMNMSIKDVDGEILLVSQFTLYGDARKGNRPSFIRAARPDKGLSYYNKLIDLLKEEVKVVETGVFGENMDVSLVNEGPVTIILDSSKIL